MSTRALIVALAGAGALCWRYYQNKHRPKLPPGPPSYPVIGQILSAPTSFEQLQYKSISDQLKSDIISLQFLGYTIVVLSSAELASHLLEKRSTLYSDRPQTTMLTDPKLLDWKDLALFTQYGERLRAYRRTYNAWLNKTATAAFHDYQVAQTRKMLHQFLGFGNQLVSSEALDKEISRLTTACVLNAAYGYDVGSLDDPFVLLARRAVDIASQATLPTNFFVNVFPSMLLVPEWLPGTSWKQLAREWRAEKERALNEPFDWAKYQIATGVAKPSVVRSMMEDIHGQATAEDFKTKEDDCGSDTMAGTLMAFILAMTLFPQAQVKAQLEIDSLIGSSRLPEIGDRENLPYINSLIQEVMRWRPVLPLGVPHACSQDDHIQGYYIPKGAIVLGNIWAITRDEKIYKDPEDFNPDRFLDPNTPHAPNFGWGRRKCPGTHFADSLLFVSIASILAAFTIKGAENNKGHDPHADIPANGII